MVKALVFGWLMLTLPAVGANQKLVVATEVWPPHYTNAQGTGLYQEIAKAVFHDYELEFKISSYERSKHYVKTGEADFWIGAYHHEEPWAAYPKHAFDADEIVAIFHAERFSLNAPLEQFQSARAAWVTEYHLHLYFPQFNFDYYEAHDIETGLNMLLGGRIDLFLNDLTDTKVVFTHRPHLEQSLVMVPFSNLELYPAFYNDQDSLKLIHLWDERLANMKRTGRLRQLYAQFDEAYILPE